MTLLRQPFAPTPFCANGVLHRRRQRFQVAPGRPRQRRPAPADAAAFARGPVSGHPFSSVPGRVFRAARRFRRPSGTANSTTWSPASAIVTRAIRSPPGAFRRRPSHRHRPAPGHQPEGVQPRVNESRPKFRRDHSPDVAGRRHFLTNSRIGILLMNSGFGAWGFFSRGEK
jgi:hypothetical protein